MKRGPAAALLAAGACVAATGGCAHLQYGSVPSPTPSPAVSASPAAGACVGVAAPGAQIVVISPLITPVVNATYGVISGYGLVTAGSAGNVATPIVVVPSATVQFFNNDLSNSQLRYSAAGIAGVTAFPSPSYTFPPSATATAGTQIGNAVWSTGLLGGQCYSQAFTIAAPGTYYFGDVTYYGLGNIRDVIVATSSPTP